MIFIRIPFSQANVSGMLPVRPVVEEQPRPRQQKPESIILKAKEELRKEKTAAVGAGPHELLAEREKSPEPSTSKTAPPVEPPRKRHVEFTREDLERLESETQRLDENNTVLYSLESVVNNGSSDEIPDSFFDLTLADARVLMSQLKESTRSMDNAPLMTAKLRELEDAKKTLVQLQYRETLIRIQFPSRLVLQTVFKPITTVAMVKQFLRSFLNEDVEEFDLCEWVFCFQVTAA